MKRIQGLVFLFLINPQFIFAQNQITSVKSLNWVPLPDNFTGNAVDWAVELRREFDPMFKETNTFLYVIDVGAKSCYMLVYFIQDVDHIKNQVAPWFCTASAELAHKPLS